MKPKNIPAGAQNVYKNKGWISWGDFLGNGVVSDRKKSFRSFKIAKEFAKSLKLKSSSEWFNLYKQNKFNYEFPRNAATFYKNKGWKGWDDFLRNE